MRYKFIISLRSTKTGKPLKRKKVFFAATRAEAHKQALDADLNPIGIETIDVWHELFGIAGITFKNADNTHRQRAIRECMAGDRVTLQHEEDNRHDKNAVCILDSNSRQLGYVPREIAATLMDWYEPGRSPLYCAIVEEIRTFDNGGSQPVVLLVAAPLVTSRDRILEYLSKQGNLGESTSLIPKQILRTGKRLTQNRGRKAASDAGQPTRTPSGEMLSREDKVGCSAIIALACLAIVILFFTGQ